MSTAKNIVENVLSIPTTRKLWTSIYLPALPFTPQDFSMGAVLPAVLYMFRWGHRRGQGTFVKSFGKEDSGKIKSPTIEDIVKRLTERSAWFSGFENQAGKAILGDILLSFCLENKNHQTGRNEQVQRAYPTHYLASWIDLPQKVTNLRYIPEMLISLLSNQEEGEFIIINNRRSRFAVSAGFEENILLNLFGTDMQIKGSYQTDLTSDQFMEMKNEGYNNMVGLDQLLTVRIAQACGEAPMRAGGGGESEKILNQHPLAKIAAKYFREDLSVFVQAYGRTVPRQAFLQMLESCLSLGLTNIYLSTAKMLFEWERTGVLSRDQEQQAWPLFIDCSSGNDNKLRRLAEASMYDLLRRFERIPVIMGVRQICWYSLSRSPVLPKIFPSVTEIATPQGNDAICSFDCPMHPGLFQPLSNNRAATRFQNPGANKESLSSKFIIPHSLFVFLKIADLPFTYSSFFFRRRGKFLYGCNYILYLAGI